MERLVRVAKKLRLEERFNGYIHLKTIPGASDELIREAGLYADRLSINLEIPTKEGLKLLAPEKDHKQMLSNVEFVKNELAISTIEKQKYKHAPKFAPAGQTTQMIIGATNETDQKNHTRSRLYVSEVVPKAGVLLGLCASIARQ